MSAPNCEARASCKCPAHLADAEAWRKETAKFARTPREPLERFKVRWRADMWARVGYTGRATMPPLVSMRAWVGQYRARMWGRIERAESPAWRRDRAAWETCVERFDAYMGELAATADRELESSPTPASSSPAAPSSPTPASSSRPSRPRRPRAVPSPTMPASPAELEPLPWVASG